MRGKLLLHICCAPDATVPFPALIDEGYSVTGFMYGGNIHPAEEYAKRRSALDVLCSAIDAEAFAEEWNPDPWLAVAGEFAAEPEGGKRCRLCFAMQLAAAARYAAENGFTCLASTLTISPHKDPALINEIGALAAEEYGLVWVEKIWRKNGGFQRSVNESKRLELYRQNYCGCVYSERTGGNGRQ